MATPKTFQEMIRQAMCGGALENTPERAYRVFREFLALKFQKAMCQWPEMERELDELFEDIVQRDWKEKPMTLEEWKKKE